MTACLTLKTNSIVAVLANPGLEHGKDPASAINSPNAGPCVYHKVRTDLVCPPLGAQEIDRMAAEALAAGTRQKVLIVASLVLLTVASPLARAAEAADMQTPVAPVPAVTAQATESGSITGVVVGSDDTVYEGAVVTLEPLRRSSTTDAMGSFRFDAVPAGQYTLTVSAPGFQTAHQAITLSAGEPLALPGIPLEIAATTTQVTVTSDDREIAIEEVHAEEHQRVFGVIPNFYVVYDKNAPPLTTRQKYELAWRSSIDPFTFIGTGAEAGIQQATNAFSGYGQGAAGYGDRFGADFGDNLLGTYLGSAVFPSIFHQDPRYLVLGSGTVRHRTLYAIANAVICRGDNGKWQFNYSGIMGSLIAAGVSNFYYPAVNRHGASLTFENFGIGLGASAASNIFQEFFVRKFTPHAHPQTDTP